ncbi:endonuclease/exonuclease/phosphatase family protein [Medicago truncatula]|uniref:Endonuclease/exonuclease/phosphatase family protein n=1 Tax=Medicago truncatula TaxID=3880 RepID=A0A072V7M7_MEDTR|nr:endonuclease/exonuclease/phosphatase family protein [Medicago truncatula]
MGKKRESIKVNDKKGVGDGSGQTSTGLILGWSKNHFTKLHEEIDNRWIYVEGGVQYPQPVKVSIMLVYLPRGLKARKAVYDAIEDKLRSRRAAYPFMVMGDFNEILQVGERKGRQESGRGMTAFRDWLEQPHSHHLTIAMISF